MNEEDYLKKITAKLQSQPKESGHEAPEPPQQLKVFPKKELPRLKLPVFVRRAGT